MKKTAVISECGLYRYHLTRTWDETKPVMAWLMLNPSTADGDVDDQTIRKCMGFAGRWGYGSIEVVNLFGLRSTDPKGLNVVDPIGPENDRYIVAAFNRATLTVAAWGAHKVNGRDHVVVRALTSSGALYCIETTKYGHPWHPCMAAYTANPVLFAAQGDAYRPTCVKCGLTCEQPVITMNPDAWVCRGCRLYDQAVKS